MTNEQYYKNFLEKLDDPDLEGWLTVLFFYCKVELLLKKKV